MLKQRHLSRGTTRRAKPPRPDFLCMGWPLLRAVVLCWLLAAPLVAAAEALGWGEKGLTWRDNNENWRLQLGGRLHVDALAGLDDGGDSAAVGEGRVGDDIDIRRARITLNAFFGSHWQAVLDRDVGGTGKGWRNVWLGYGRHKPFGGPGWSVRAGHFIAPFSQEELTSSDDLLLIERSTVNSLAPSYHTGVEGSYLSGHWLVRAGYFWHVLDDDFGTAVDRQDTLGAGPVARVVWSLWQQPGRHLQVGFSGQARQLDDGSVFQVDARPEAGLTDLRLVDTGRLADVDAIRAWAWEGLWQQGAWSLEAEYQRLYLDRTAHDNARLQGAYVQLAWVLTGEQRAYSSGKRTLGEVRPHSGWGALTLALRWSYLDLDDHSDSAAGGLAGGRLQNWTVGVNWALRPNLRILANYVHARAFGGVPGRDVDLLESRLQINF